MSTERFLEAESADAGYLFIVGEPSHDCWVHDPVQQHGERVDGEVGVVQVPLHHVADLLVGQLHRLHGVLQRTDLLLFDEIRQLSACFGRHYVHTRHYFYARLLMPTIRRQHAAWRTWRYIMRRRRAWETLTTHTHDTFTIEKQ